MWLCLFCREATVGRGILPSPAYSNSLANSTRMKRLLRRFVQLPPSWWQTDYFMGGDTRVMDSPICANKCLAMTSTQIISTSLRCEIAVSLRRVGLEMSNLRVRLWQNWPCLMKTSGIAGLDCFAVGEF